MDTPLLTPEKRHELYSRARKTWRNKDIAEAIGTTPDNLSNIIKRASANSRYLPALDRWLLENERNPDRKTAAADHPEHTPDVLLAMELEALAAYLRSPRVSNDMKAFKYVTFIRAAHAQLEAFQAAIKEGR